MDLDKLRVFHAVAHAGSFTHAGEQLALSQSAVSRQISTLEEDLKVPLFTRHARGLILTEQCGISPHHKDLAPDIQTIVMNCGESQFPAFLLLTIFAIQAGR